MFILEDPYVSDLLAATVNDLGLPVLDTPVARARLTGNAASLIMDDAALAAKASQPGARVYSNSENAIGWIAGPLADTDLPSDVDLSAIESVDYKRFASCFSNVLELRPTDFNRYPVFAFTFVEVRSEDLSELHAVLGADLREYLRMR